MMQLQRTKRQEAIEAAAPLPGPGAAAGAAGPVHVIAGADAQDMDLVGRLVADARAVAQAIFGIHPAARALVDGREVGEAHVLGPGQLLEFVKHAGVKGAAPAAEPAGQSVIELTEDRAIWRRGDRQLGTTSVHELLARTDAGASPQTWRLHPRQVRLMAERHQGRVTGVVIEMPPGPRQVRWATGDSYDPLGALTARYETRHLSFPWVVLVIVFVDGELSGFQQAFYRNAPVTSLDDHLCYTNLLNVARGHGQESWVCLVNLGRRLARLGWEERTQAVTEHFWRAAFNRSAEFHEGNSFWGTMRKDPRFASPAAWEDATRANPYFALDVGWKRAPRSLGQTLEHMLDLVAPWRPIERVEQLVTVMQQQEGA
jgi:hypothetical protein